MEYSNRAGGQHHHQSQGQQQQQQQQQYSAYPTSAAFVPPSSSSSSHGGGAGIIDNPPSSSAPASSMSSSSSSSSTLSTRQMLNVKAFYNEEIRRITLPEPSWERLTQRLAELFRFPSTDAFLVKWKDEEDDYITLDSDEELAQALHYTDAQQLLRLYVVSRDAPQQLHPHQQHQQHGVHGGAVPPNWHRPGAGLQLPLAPQGHFTSFFTHATPYTSFAATPYPPRGFAPAPLAPSSGNLTLQTTAGQTATPSNNTASAPSDAATAGAKQSAPQPIIATPAAPVGGAGILATSPIGTTAVALFATKREFKEQWKNEKRALKEQKYLCSNKEEWKSLKKEQKKALKRQKELAKTTHKIMKMEREFDPQDPKDQIKMYKLQQKQYKTTARALYARFVKHVSIPDGTEMGPDTPFTKTWRFRNEGTMAWPQEVTLMFISKINGDQMGAPEFVPVNKIVMPGEEVDVSVHMVSPSRAGHYQAYFRLCYGPKKFGQRVWIKINVACTSDNEADDDESEHTATTKKEVDNLTNEDSASNTVASQLPTTNSDPMQSLLQKLSDLGFEDRSRNASLLTKHSGNIDLVVDELLNSRNSTNHCGAQ